MSFLSARAPRRRGGLVFDVAVVAVVTFALSAPTGATAAIADAGTASRPVANDDSFSVYASGEYTLDVLGNDTTTLLSSGDLTLCGVTVDDTTQQVLYAEIDRTDPSLIFVETNRNANGVVSFTYDACQGDQRDTSTVQVDISKLASPKVTKPRKRGRITATNPNDVRLQILWGSNRNNVNDGRRGIRADRKVIIKVKRRRIFWVAYLVDQGTVVVAGEGTVKRIKKAN